MYSMSLRLSSISCAILLTLPMWAAPLPEALTHALRQREQFFINRTLTYRLKTDKKIIAPPRQFHSETLLSITRFPTSLHIRTRPAYGTSTSTSDIVNLEQMQWSAEFHLIEGVSVEVEPDFYVSESNRSLNVRGTIAHVNRASVSEYGAPSSNEACLAATWLAGVFAVGLNVANLPDIRWEKIEDRPDRWVLHGKAKDYRSIALNPHIDWRQLPVPEVRLRIELRKPDALPLLAVAESTEGRDRGRTTLRILAQKRVETLTVPAQIELLRESAVGSERAIYTLLKIARASEKSRLNLPTGTLVVDERLGNPVNYRWQGRLPTEEELKQLAYQQGNLIPPETPRRRFSPLLFAPAIIFFALAAYLYFKNRRR